MSGKLSSSNTKNLTSRFGIKKPLFNEGKFNNGKSQPNTSSNNVPSKKS